MRMALPMVVMTSQLRSSLLALSTASQFRSVQVVLRQGWRLHPVESARLRLRCAADLRGRVMAAKIVMRWKGDPDGNTGLRNLLLRVVEGEATGISFVDLAA
jgi:hypothetical protein